MKECPRCGSSLSAYSLSDVEAYGCDSCGWVGVPVDHKSEPKRLESWQDAIQRFQKKFAADGLEEHAERLERVEQARRDAVNGAVDETEAAGDGGPATAEDEGDEPAVDDETTEDDAGTEPEETTDGTEEGTDVPDDGDAADSEAATTAGDGSEPDAPDESEADAGEAADSDDTDDETEAADEEPSSDDEEVEVAADGAGQ